MNQPKESFKIFAVITVARQIDGEYVFIKTEKGWRTDSPNSARKAQDYLDKLKATFATKEGKARPVAVQTPNGDASCLCEAGVFEIEVEE